MTATKPHSRGSCHCGCVAQAQGAPLPSLMGWLWSHALGLENGGPSAEKRRGSPHLLPLPRRDWGLSLSRAATRPPACAHWCSIWKLRCPLNQSLKKDCSTLQVAASCRGERVSSWRRRQDKRPGLLPMRLGPTWSQGHLQVTLSCPASSAFQSPPETPDWPTAYQWKATGSPTKAQRGPLGGQVLVTKDMDLWALRGPGDQLWLPSPGC